MNSGLAEQQAITLLENVRQKLTLAIVRNPLSVFGAKAVRDELAQQLKDFRTQVHSKFAFYLREAWREGITDTNGPSALPDDIGFMLDELTGAFDELIASIQRKVTTEINHAILSNDSKDTLLSAIGSDQGTGLFEGFQSRAVGIVSHEMTMAYQHARESRVHETSEQKKLQARLRQPQKINGVSKAKKLNVVAIKIWLHSMGGNPPRAHHVAMHGKAVMSDQQFIVLAPQGEVFHPTAPHDPKLPTKEKKNCHCTTSSKMLYMTDEEEAKLRAQMAATGGVLGVEWEKFSEEAGVRMMPENEPNKQGAVKEFITIEKRKAAVAHKQ